MKTGLLVAGVAALAFIVYRQAQASERQALDPWSEQNFVETAESRNYDESGLAYFQPQFTSAFDEGVYQQIIGGD